ncbi:MAG: hypothetical protein BAJALOKI2v1_690021 [Promethearchaeota archaeon]|nr:MAG: hypothetical protein BAJALOKI2v1_690021 [Candidatus Lokiarchaeota archaeon]
MPHTPLKTVASAVREGQETKRLLLVKTAAISTQRHSKSTPTSTRRVSSPSRDILKINITSVRAYTVVLTPFASDDHVAAPLGSRERGNEGSLFSDDEVF